VLWEPALTSAIEVAIAIAGFSGIVAAVGRRGAGHWTAGDQLRLRILLTASGMSLVFAFLPFVLVDVLEPARSWRLGSGLQALYFFGISIHRFRQASAGGIASAIGISRSRAIVQAAAVLMLVANASWYASASLYVLGVLWSVFIAFMTFATLLLEASRQSAAESLPAD
jgi:hypothetical protein